MEDRFQQEWDLEAGIDEAGRGCLAGRVYTACVILPTSFPDDTYLQIKDSKKLSKKKRDELRSYIEKHAIAYAVEYAEADEIDEVNILQATMNCMHRAVTKIKVKPDYLIVDGTYFKPCHNQDGSVIPYTAVKGADNKFRHVAAASILAKTYHDEYVMNLLLAHPECDKYGWKDNMCYGTAKHLEAIKQYGITPFHRQSFGICKEIKTGIPMPPKKKRTKQSIECMIQSDSEDDGPVSKK